MARKKNAPKEDAEPSAAEDFAKDEPLQRPQEEIPAEKPKSIDIVRAALAAGFATAKVALPWIKETYGVDMKAGNFSVTKSTIERGKGGTRTVKKQSRAPRMSEPIAAPVAAAPATPTHTGNGHMSPSEAARSVKELVDKLGAKEVKNLVDLFGG